MKDVNICYCLQDVSKYGPASWNDRRGDESESKYYKVVFFLRVLKRLKKIKKKNFVVT